MTAPAVRPPVVAERLLIWSLAGTDRAAVVGDLHEEFLQRAALDGRDVAGRWYWRQTVRSLTPNLRRRFTTYRGAQPRNSRPSMMHGALPDLRFAIRMLRRRPLMTTAALLSLALGIGLSSGVFGLFEAAVLRPLPVRAPGDLRVILEARERGENHNFTYPGFAAFRSVQQSFTDVVAFSLILPALRTDAGSAPLAGELVTGSYFPTIGPAVAMGRGLTDRDNEPDADPVVVLSSTEWRERFGDAQSLGGASVVLNGATFAVVGVTAAPFRGMTVGRDARFWVPIAHQPIVQPFGGGSLLTMPTVSWLTVVGRLKPGVADEAALAEVNASGQSLTQRPEGVTARFMLIPGGQGDSSLPASAESPLQLLLGAAILVLLVACANVAGLLLARTQERAREIAVRTALGASRWRIARLLLFEALALGLLGAALGVLAARSVAPLTVAFFSDFGRSVTLDIALNAEVLAFAAAMGIGAALLAGIAPAWRTAAALGPGRLTGAERADTASRSATAWRRGLVVAQFALTLALVVTSGLLVRTLANLRAIPTGLDVDHVALLFVDPTAAQYDQVRAAEYFDDAIRRLEETPGVRRAAYARVPPVGFGGSRSTIFVPGYAPQGDEDMEINHNVVSTGYFDALGIGLVDGRTFDSSDRSDRSATVVVNETMASRYWPGRRAVGQIIHLGNSVEGQRAEVIGVVRDVKYRTLREEARPSFYRSAGTEPLIRGGVIHVRTVGTPDAMLDSLRRIVAAADANVPVAIVRTLGEQVSLNITRERGTMVVGATLGASAVLLSAVGLFAAMATMVGRRSRELGVRLALGALPADVSRMVLREGVVLALWGSLAGIGLAYVLGHLVESRLYGVSAFDPASLAASSVLLSIVALVAAWMPARRAARVDPLLVLKVE